MLLDMSQSLLTESYGGRITEYEACVREILTRIFVWMYLSVVNCSWIGIQYEQNNETPRISPVELYTLFTFCLILKRPRF